MRLLADRTAEARHVPRQLRFADSGIIDTKYVDADRLQRLLTQRPLVQRENHCGGTVFGAYRQGTLHIQDGQRIVQIEESFQGLRVGGADHAHGVAEHMQEIGEILHIGLDRLPIATYDGEYGQDIGRRPRDITGQFTQLLSRRFGVDQGNLKILDLTAHRMRHDCAVCPQLLRLHQLPNVDIGTRHEQRAGAYRVDIVRKRGHRHCGGK